jgi:hypothetical protein
MKKMRRHSRRVGTAFYGLPTIAAVVILTILFVGATPSQAQSRTVSDLDTRQKALRSMEKTPEKRSESPEEREQQRLDYEQSREDFELLQVVSGRLPKMIGSGPATHDYGQIGRDAAEIRKRAARLRIYLSLAESKKDEKLKKSAAAFSPAELKSAIATLDDLIRNFVENPVFQHSGVLNAEQWVKAGRDLEWIITLSEQIQKSAEALSKAAGKNL